LVACLIVYGGSGSISVGEYAMQLARCAAFLAVLSLSTQAAAKGPVAEDLTEKLVTFQEALDEIHRARTSGDWQDDGWKPHITRNYLDYFLEEVKRATKREQLALPVGFDEAKPVLQGQPFARQQPGLYVVDDGKFPLLRNSIVLADGCVEISMAENCVVIARGAVSISHSKRNFVLAGHYASVNFDRSSDPRAGLVVAPPGAAPAMPADVPAGSVIFSGEVLDMSFAQETICCGLKRLSISHADPNAVVLNSPQRELSSLARCQIMQAAQVPFAVRSTNNALENKLHITQVVAGTSGLAVVQGKAVEYVLRAGMPLTDDQGQPLAGLEQWKLKHLGRNYALFANGTQYAGLRASP
jgi:hypothetical protein